MNLIIFSCLSYVHLLVFFCELSMSFFYFSIGLLILYPSILKPSLCIREITFCLYKCCEYFIAFCQLSSDFFMVFWAFFILQLSHPYMTNGKNQSFD